MNIASDVSETARRPDNAGRLMVVAILSFGELYLSAALSRHREV
jgi:hypothetical protein